MFCSRRYGNAAGSGAAGSQTGEQTLCVTLKEVPRISNNGPSMAVHPLPELKDDLTDSEGEGEGVRGVEGRVFLASLVLSLIFRSCKKTKKKNKY